MGGWLGDKGVGGGARGRDLVVSIRVAVNVLRSQKIRTVRKEKQTHKTFKFLKYAAFLEILSQLI